MGQNHFIGPSRLEFYVGLRLRLLRYDSPDGVSSTVLVFMGTSGVEFYVASCSLGFCLPVARLRQETVRSSPTVPVPGRLQYQVPVCLSYTGTFELATYYYFLLSTGGVYNSEGAD
jgi:hypothetical protein